LHTSSTSGGSDDPEQMFGLSHQGIDAYPPAPPCIASKAEDLIDELARRSLAWRI
jgi:hypothetical protein